MKPKISILTDWYTPAYKAGGPIVSLSNLVDCLHNHFSIRILTSNLDMKSTINVPKNKWIHKEKCSIIYSDLSYFNVQSLLNNKDNINDSTLYLNSVYSLNFTIIPLLLIKFGFLQPKKVIIAPRGMLQLGAMNLKSTKKNIFLKFSRTIGLYKNCYFHATDDTEKEDIVKHFKIPEYKISIVSNIPRNFDLTSTCSKITNELQVIFMARLSKKKNLEEVLQYLSCVNKKYTINLDIYGPTEGKYFDNLSDFIDSMGQNIIINYCGELEPDKLEDVLKNYHVYILPTKGENFGHSIFEALSMGLPVIISDQTPWRNLEAQKVGFDIPLEEPNRFIKAIEHFARCSESEWKEWSINSKLFADNFYNNQNFEKVYKRLFKLKINVGFVAPITLTRYKGGISVLAEHYLSHKSVLEEQGIELHLFNTCILPRENESMGKFRWINIINYIKFVTKSIAKIKEEKTDLLHYNTSVGLSLLKDIVTVRIFKILTSTEAILHIHFTDIRELQNKNTYRKILIFFLKRIHRIVVLSNKLRQDLLDLGLESNKVIVIQNYSMLSFEHTISPSQGKINIIFMGSVNRRKGVLDLFEAMQNLPSNIDWHMHVAGDFTSKDFKHQFFSKLEETNLINKVTFHGYVSDKEKKKLFEMSSILALPSYSEGMPLSILEGLSAGCAILATNVGANIETINSVANLIQPGDIEAIKYELEKLLTNSQYLKNRQKQSLELSKKFSFKKFVDHIVPLYNESIL